MSATIPDRTLVERFAYGYIDALSIPYQKKPGVHGHAQLHHSSQGGGNNPSTLSQSQLTQSQAESLVDSQEVKEKK